MYKMDIGWINVCMCYKYFSKTNILVGDAHDTITDMYDQLYLWIYLKNMHVQCNSFTNYVFGFHVWKIGIL